MMKFTREVHNWLGFFSLLGGVTASFAGLLFVAMALNASKFKLAEHRSVFLLARQTFSNLLLIVTLCLVTHVPMGTDVGFGVAYFTACVGGIWTCYVAIREERRMRGKRAPRLEILRAYYGPLAFYIILAVPSAQMMLARSEQLELLAPGLLMLLLGSARNAWLLLFILD